MVNKLDTRSDEMQSRSLVRGFALQQCLPLPFEANPSNLAPGANISVGKYRTGTAEMKLIDIINEALEIVAEAEGRRRWNA